MPAKAKPADAANKSAAVKAPAAAKAAPAKRPPAARKVAAKPADKPAKAPAKPRRRAAKPAAPLPEVFPLADPAELACLATPAPAPAPAPTPEPVPCAPAPAPIPVRPAVRRLSTVVSRKTVNRAIVVTVGVYVAGVVLLLAALGLL